jgi:hypothetical protein
MQLADGRELGQKFLSCLEPGETPTFAAWLMNATVNGGSSWSIPLLLLTSHRLIISKEKLLGRPKADFAVAWPGVSTVGSGSIALHGIELIVTTTRVTVSVVVRSEHAVEVESAIRAGYLSNPGHPAHRRT